MSEFSGHALAGVPLATQEAKSDRYVPVGSQAGFRLARNLEIAFLALTTTDWLAVGDFLLCVSEVCRQVCRLRTGQFATGCGFGEPTNARQGITRTILRALRHRN